MQRMARLVVAGALAAALLMGAVLIPLMEERKPAGFYADVVTHDDQTEEHIYAASGPVEVSRR